jgi:OmpA-OmpF porin, OOP family
MQSNSLIQSLYGWSRGLLPLALICGLSPLLLTGQIESDLTARTAQVREQSSSETATWATIKVEGRDVFAQGTAPSTTARVDLAKVIDDVDGVRKIVDKTWDIAVAEPFQWNAIKDGSQLILTGFVPPSGQRSALVQQAQATFPKLRVSDNMTEAGGAPADFAAKSAFALTALKELSVGSVELLNSNFSIRGTALTTEAYNATLAATKTLPSDLTLKVAEVTAPLPSVPVETASIGSKAIPPYVWIASHDGKEIALTGAVPDSGTRQKLLDTARRSFNTLSVTDKMNEQTAGVPQGFATAAEAMLVQLAHLEAGSAAITDQKLTLIGLAPNEEVVGQAKTAVSQLPNTIAGTTSVVARPKAIEVTAAGPAANTAENQICAKALTEATSQGRIQFESWSAKLVPASKPVIKNLATLLNGCPALKVEVSGHTDSSGEESLNQSLSKWRAAAVVKALTKAGVNEGRLSAQGFGATKPVASNDTKDGRAINRRIELNIVQ